MAPKQNIPKQFIPYAYVYPQTKTLNQPIDLKPNDYYFICYLPLSTWYWLYSQAPWGRREKPNRQQADQQGGEAGVHGAP